MECLLLFLASIVYFSYAYIAFNDFFDKNSYNYFTICMIIGFFYSLIWYWSTKIVDNKEEFFIFVLMWDLVYIAVFYFTPLIFFNVKLDYWGIFGMITMVIGLIIMKIGHMIN
jgi:hypothetical protein